LFRDVEMLDYHVQVMIVKRQLQRMSMVPLVPLEDTKLVEFVEIEQFVSKVVYAYVRLGKRRMARLRAIAGKFGGWLGFYIVIT
jgi:hypothetical protein